MNHYLSTIIMKIYLNIIADCALSAPTVYSAAIRHQSQTAALQKLKCEWFMFSLHLHFLHFSVGVKHFPSKTHR